MKHILILISLVFIAVGACNLMQPPEDLSIIGLGLSAVGAIYLIIMMLTRKLRGGSG